MALPYREGMDMTEPTSNAGNASRPASAEGTGKRKRRGLWWKVLLGLLIAILLLVILAPTLLSTGPGRGFLLGQINGRIAGTASADLISLGWMSGIKVKNFELKDPEGGRVAKVETLETGLTLLDALSSGSMDLGTVLLRGGVVELKTGADGKTNLDRALAGKAPAKAEGPAKDAGGKPSIIRGTIDGELESFSATTPNSPPLLVEKTTIKGTLDTSGPIQLTVAGKAINPDKTAASFSLKADGNFFDQGALKPIGGLRGNGELSLDAFDLAGVTALLKARGIDLQITGIAGGKIVLAESGGKQTLTGNFAITKSPTVTGAMLQGDTLKLSSCNAEVAATLSGDTVDLQKFVVATDVGNIGASGVVKLSSVGTGPLPPLTVKGAIDVSTLKRQLPKLLGTLPDTHAKMDVTGTADLAQKTFTVTGDSMVGEQDPSSGQGNTVQLAKGSIVSWGDAPNNVNGRIVYALGRIQQILAKQLPEGTVLEGSRTVEIRLTGGLTQDKGLRALRRLTLARTAIGEDRVSMNGLELGRGDIGIEMKDGVLTILPSDIPANGGTLHLRGRVDFNADPPALIIDKELQPVGIVRDLKINQEVAAGPLAFLPILWGSQALDSKGKGGNFATVGGLFNMRIDQAYIPLDAEGFKRAGMAAGSFDVRELVTESPLFAEIAKQLGPVLKMTQPDLLSIRSGQIPTVAFNLKEGRVSYKDLVLGTQKESLVFSGWVGVDGSLEMSMEVRIASGGLGGLGQKLGSGKGIDMAIPVMLTGTIRKPSVKVSLNKETMNQTINNVAPLIDDLMKKKK